MARKFLAGLGLAFGLLLVAPSAAPLAGDGVGVPVTRSPGDAKAGQAPAMGIDGSRAVSINSDREAELRRQDAERDRREVERLLLDAEREAQGKRNDADNRLLRTERNTLQRNESAMDRELRIRNLRDETRRADSERWQVEDLERRIRPGRIRLGNTRPVGGSLR